MRIASFGDINIDVVLDVERLPRLGEEVFSTSRVELLGGSAVNTGVALTRLGHRVVAMGAVGADDAGDRALRLLDQAGVDTGLTTRSVELPTAMNTVMVTPDGERTMIGARGANVAYTAPSGWDEDIDWLHVSGYSLLEGAQRESAIDVVDTAHDAGVPTSLDVPSGVGQAAGVGLGPRLGRFTVVTGSRGSLGDLTGSDRPMEYLVEAGVRRVAMTSGAGPLTLAVESERVELTPPRVVPIDSTGAGDALVAGLIAATLGGLEVGPSAVLAACVGAAATLVKGAAGTLGDPGLWPLLLDPERWSDAHTGWLDTVRDLIAG